jgi:hypothetical protein
MAVTKTELVISKADIKYMFLPENAGGIGHVWRKVRNFAVVLTDYKLPEGKMKRSLLPLLCLFMACAAMAQYNVTRLSVEHMPAPAAVDVAQPRLSWVNEVTDPNVRGESQTAYRVVVASSAAKLQAGDYDLWTQYLIPKRDTVRMTNVLTQYYNSGQYPEEWLQYHFNELQGMEEGSVYIAPHPGEMVAKLILQYVLGVHKDKILYDEDAAMDPDYVKDVFGRIGIPFSDEIWNQLWSMWQDKTLTAIMRYIFDHSKRPVYLSAHDIWQHIIGQGLPDELKARLYNEGLTIRYSTTPYDNRAVKRRNIEQRYRLEYLRMPFHPEMKNTQRFSFSADAYAMNYMRLLQDQLPYYKKHNWERYQWLYDIFTDIIERLEKENYDVDEFKGYLK